MLGYINYEQSGVPPNSVQLKCNEHKYERARTEKDTKLRNFITLEEKNTTGADT